MKRYWMDIVWGLMICGGLWITIRDHDAGWAAFFGFALAATLRDLQQTMEHHAEDLQSNS